MIVYSDNEKAIIVQNINMYGGSFMKALGDALCRADHFNYVKLIKAFKPEFDKYLEMG